MSQSEDSDTDHSVERFRPVMRQAKCAAHHAKTYAADRARHHEAMLHDAAAKRERADDHRQAEAKLMNPGGAEA